MENVKAIFQKLTLERSRRADSIFKFILVAQWLSAITIAIWSTPFSYQGTIATIHLHVYLAIFLGGLLAIGPILAMKLFPDSRMNRDIVAVAQSLFSILLIHITGGRIETHFHVFGSLAFLGAYGSRSPLWICTGITITDHLVRGYFWPESIYGVQSAEVWRALEHGAWVVFELVFLLMKVDIHSKQTWALSETQVQLESAVAYSAKMSSLGEVMSSICHEINNPVSTIKASVELFERKENNGTLELNDAKQTFRLVQRNIGRIVKIVRSLKNYSRSAAADPFETVVIKTIIDDVVELCRDSIKSAGIDLRVQVEEGLTIDCRPSEIEQVLLNLINNARDAIQNDTTSKWIEVQVTSSGEEAILSVTDSGLGIPPETSKMLMTPFFSTKPSGKGTGLGLSISKRVAEGHKGSLVYSENCKNTCFTLRIPRHASSVKVEPMSAA